MKKISLLALLLPSLLLGSFGSNISNNTLGLSCTDGQVPEWNATGFTQCLTASGSGTVTSVGMSVPATSIFGVTGTPVTASGTLGLTTTGTSGGVPYFSSTSKLSSSALLTASQLVLGGGAGAAPTTLAAGSQYQVLTMGASNPGYGAVNLAQSAAVTGTLAVGNGGTNSSTALSNNRVMKSAAGAIVEAAAISASLALCSDANGIPVACGSTTTTEAGYVHGVTSAIQTQLNAKLPTTGVGLVDEITGMLESPTDKTYTLDFKAAFGYTVNTIDVATASGTTTVALKINGTNITGCSAVSVSSTPATGSCSAANTLSAGDQFTMVLSSSSSPVDMAFTIKYTR